MPRIPKKAPPGAAIAHAALQRKYAATPQARKAAAERMRRYRARLKHAEPIDAQ